MNRAELGLVVALGLSCVLAASSARAGETDTPATASPEVKGIVEPPPEKTAAPVATPAPIAEADRGTSRPVCPNCCQASVDAAARIGLSINGDQWLSGGQLRTSFPCLGRLGFGPLLVLGVGGNHITFRSAFRLDYLFWFDRAHDFGAYPAIGAAVLFYLPVGDFAEFCHRVALDECSGYLFGAELGGGLRYRRFSIDAFAGFGGLPVLSIMAVLHFPLTGPEVR